MTTTVPVGLGYPDRPSAEEASREARGTPGAYELDDGSWAAAREMTLGSDGGRHHWGSLRDGRLVQLEHGSAPGTWRVQESR